MALLSLYPREHGATHATLALVEVLDGTPAPTLADDSGAAIPVNWQADLSTGATRVRIGIAAATNLAPDREHTFTARARGRSLSRAVVRTLPAALGGTESPLRIVLASCYSRLRPESRRARDAFADLRRAHGIPHLKIWCGDQVYLDSPWHEYTLRWPHRREDIAERHLQHYLNTWSGEHLGNPLACGANYFVPDDHEYWNNAPFPNALVPELFDGGRRDHWWVRARELLDAFQPVQATPLSIPPVSILLLDTRSNRSHDRERLLTAQDLQRLRDWVQSLTGPGLLVLGQPLFDGSGRKWWLPGALEDYGYADFWQYGRVLDALALTRHDLAILTGDVHFSRVSWLTLPSERRIAEIVCSPLALVVGLNAAKWQEAPSRLAVGSSGPWAVARPYTIPGFRSNENSAMAISISRHGFGARIRVELWETSRSPGAAGPPAALTHELLLN